MTQGEINNVMRSRSYRRFVESGDNEKAASLVCHGYVLTSLGIYCIEEANSLLAKHGLFQHGLKQTANDFSRAFDQHSRVMQSFLPDLPAKLQFCEAIDKIRPQIEQLIADSVQDILQQSTSNPQNPNQQ